MRLVFVSIYISAHLLPVCENLYKELGDNFRFISTGKISDERKKLGWLQITRDYETVVDLENDDLSEVSKAINDADVVIYGTSPDSLLADRIKSGKLTFKYCERLYKGTFSFKRWIKAYIGTYLHYARFKKYNFYILCASSYTSKDLNKFFNFKNRCFKWGYFPETLQYNNIEEFVKTKKSNSLLWVARFLKLKHPEIPVLIAEKLKKDGYNFSMTLVGSGVLEDEIKAMICEKGLNDVITLTGAIPQDKVHTYMDDSEIFLFTSDSNEGWGAVLNEAMNSACACISSDAIGSSAFLIDDGKNGFLYEDGNLDDLYEKIMHLLNNKDVQTHMGINAYKTITEEWNAEIAAKKFLNLADAILSGNDPFIFPSGVGSKS